MLQFENIKKYYGSFLALEIPYLLVDKGLWWVQGENGSGKTTFLKMIAGLHPFAGNIILEKQFSLKKQRQQYIKRVNYAEAEPLYPAFLTAKDLTELFCYTKGDDINKAKELLKQLHVYDAYD
ncbi:MAG: ATP-binding cassette domain-containing protein [Segetibacter sp.]